MTRDTQFQIEILETVQKCPELRVSWVTKAEFDPLLNDPDKFYGHILYLEEDGYLEVERSNRAILQSELTTIRSLRLTSRGQDLLESLSDPSAREKVFDQLRKIPSLALPIVQEVAKRYVMGQLGI